MNHPPAQKIIGVLLAAGLGRRFDATGQRDKLMQMLPGGARVAETSTRNLLALVPAVVAVVRAADTQLAQQLHAAGCIVSVCPTAARGMGDSLAHGVRHAQALHPDADGFLIALADMPYVQSQTLQSLLDALAQGADIAAPVFQGQRGNPVGFSRVHAASLLALEGDAGARELLRTWPVRMVAVADGGVLRDIDVAGDLSVDLG